jgi:hypothetical protein
VCAGDPTTPDSLTLNAGAPMDDADFNRRQTIRVGASVVYAQVVVIGFDRTIDLQSLQVYGLPEAAPAVRDGTPLLTGALFGSGRRRTRWKVLRGSQSEAASLVGGGIAARRAGGLAGWLAERALCIHTKSHRSEPMCPLA